MKRATKKRFSSFEPKARERAAWIVVALIVANEIRGLFVVATILGVF